MNLQILFKKIISELDSWQILMLITCQMLANVSLLVKVSSKGYENIWKYPANDVSCLLKEANYESS